LAVPLDDDATDVRARGWRTLAALHARIDAALERALVAEHGLAVVEYTVLETLSRQDGWHMRMQQVSRAAALSASATTRLVNRLESRGLLRRVLCDDDRRGIYSELTEDGSRLLTEARPTHDRVLEETLTQTREVPELAPLVASLHQLEAADAG
jgi:DNA-binding MarR family transcriptional regulator